MVKEMHVKIAVPYHVYYQLGKAHKAGTLRYMLLVRAQASTTFLDGIFIMSI